MTRDEHMDILAFFDRVLNAAEAEIDVEAEAIIRAMFKRHPEAAYRVTKLAMALARQPTPVAAPKPVGRPRQWFAALLHRNPHTVF